MFLGELGTLSVSAVCARNVALKLLFTFVLHDFVIVNALSQSVLVNPNCTHSFRQFIVAAFSRAYDSFMRSSVTAKRRYTSKDLSLHNSSKDCNSDEEFIHDIDMLQLHETLQARFEDKHKNNNLHREMQSSTSQSMCFV